ncbi:hypothetical protein B0J14DRAFT_585087 [Halenospora varia]|nr:hypothetical protein B0J14DRAFT_585087 [Halenospora varia]
MASLLITRGLHSLIASRDSTPNENVAWNAITRRDSEKQQVFSTVLLFIWFMVNIVLFVPVLFILVYTLNRLYPTLAIVEATDFSPDYELVAGKEVDIDDDRKVDAGRNSKDITIVADNSFDGKGSSATLIPDETAGIPSTPSQPVTSGLLATLRLLRATGGGIFKAYRWRFLYNCVVGIVFACLSSVPYLPYFAASIIASLAATKVETAWTHAAVSTQRDGRLWKKLPSYLAILKATAVPLVAEAVVIEIINAVAFLPLGPRTGSVDPLGVLPRFAHNDNGTRITVFIVLFFTLYTCFLVPTEVILTRTRATMLPDDASTLVPLDSSIRSQTVEQMGFMSWTHAWRTFSRASWVRIVKIYAKIFATTILIVFVVFGLIFAQVLVSSVVMQPSTAH